MSKITRIIGLRFNDARRRPGNSANIDDVFNEISQKSWDLCDEPIGSAGGMIKTPRRNGGFFVMELRMAGEKAVDDLLIFGARLAQLINMTRADPDGSSFFGAPR